MHAEKPDTTAHECGNSRTKKSSFTITLAKAVPANRQGKGLDEADNTQPHSAASAHQASIYRVFRRYNGCMQNKIENSAETTSAPRCDNQVAQPTYSAISPEKKLDKNSSGDSNSQTSATYTYTTIYRYLSVLNLPLEGAYELLHHVFLRAPLADHAWVL